MAKEILDTTNKLIKLEDISGSDDSIIRQLSDNLKDITPADVDSMCDEIKRKEEEDRKREEEKKKLKVPQWLKNFRETRKKEMDLDKDEKEKIINAVKKIPVKFELDDNGSNVVVFELGGLIYKILDPEKKHTDKKYASVFFNYVYGGGMLGDDVSKWRNKRLKRYVKQKQGEGFYIPDIAEMKKILHRLGIKADIDHLKGQIAMLSYMTGMDYLYRLSMRDEVSRSMIFCSHDHGSCYFDHGYKDDRARLLMISCDEGGKTL